MSKLILVISLSNILLSNAFFIDSKDIKKFFGLSSKDSYYDYYKKAVSDSTATEGYYYPTPKPKTRTYSRPTRYEDDILEKLEKLDRYRRNRNKQYYNNDNNDFEDVYNRDYSNNDEQVKLFNEYNLPNSGRHYKTHDCHRNHNSPVHGFHEEAAAVKSKALRSQQLSKIEAEALSSGEVPLRTPENLKDIEQQEVKMNGKKVKGESDYVRDILRTLAKNEKRNKQETEDSDDLAVYFNKERLKSFLKPLGLLDVEKDDE